MKNPPSAKQSHPSHGRSTNPQLLREIGRRLRVARETCGLSTEAAAEASQVKAAMIGRYERAESEAGALKIVALARTYGVCCNWLLGASPEMEDLAEGSAIVDVDLVEQIEAARTEAEMAQLVTCDHAPFRAILGIPKKYKVISTHSAAELGARIYDRLRTIAPKVHRQWAKRFRIGEAL